MLPKSKFSLIPVLTIFFAFNFSKLQFHPAAVLLITMCIANNIISGHQKLTVRLNSLQSSAFIFILTSGIGIMYIIKLIKEE